MHVCIGSFAEFIGPCCGIDQGMYISALAPPVIKTVYEKHAKKLMQAYTYTYTYVYMHTCRCVIKALAHSSRSLPRPTPSRKLHLSKNAPPSKLCYFGIIFDKVGFITNVPQHNIKQSGRIQWRCVYKSLAVETWVP